MKELIKFIRINCIFLISSEINGVNSHLLTSLCQNKAINLHNLLIQTHAHVSL